MILTTTNSIDNYNNDGRKLAYQQQQESSGCAGYYCLVIISYTFFIILLIIGIIMILYSFSLIDNGPKKQYVCGSTEPTLEEIEAFVLDDKLTEIPWSRTALVIVSYHRAISRSGLPPGGPKEDPAQIQRWFILELIQELLYK